MFLILFFITLIFLAIGFSAYHPYQIHIFVTYFLTLNDFILTNWFVFLFGFIILLISIFITQHGKKHAAFSKKLLISFFHSVLVILLGFLISFVFLFIIAFIHLNASALLLQVNPSLLGVQTNPLDMEHVLESSDNTPNIVTLQANENVIYAIAAAATGTDNFYGKNVLPLIPSLFILPVKKPDVSVFLLDNTIIITAVDAKVLQALSPRIGYLLVKNYFPTKNIKLSPKVSLMTKDQYVKFRNIDMKARLHTIDTLLVSITAQTSSVSARIAQEEDDTSSSSAQFTHQAVEKDNEYKKCIASGKSSDTCQNDTASYDDTLKKLEEDIHTQNTQISEEKDLLDQYKYYRNYLADRKKAMQTSSLNIPHENGVFLPKDTIQILLNTNDPHRLGDYFETLTHEYLHFSSFVSSDRGFSSSFFEEGLTEYFARQTIDSQLHLSTNVGYPVYVKIISEMTKLIPESELADIYFTKDEDSLMQTLDRVYGENFYINNFILFESLGYSTDAKQTLKIANTIMKEIGGRPLTEKDLVSTKSNLE